jgi:cysteine synthase A
MERDARAAALALAAAAAAGAAAGWAAAAWWRARAGAPRAPPPPVAGLAGLIGNTPLVRLASLSAATGCKIYGKAEFLNPGGSVKDRVALAIIDEALADGRLRPGGLVSEGTVGSTGISLALVAAARGCRAFVALPDDAAAEKADTLVALGAEVARVRPVAITHPGHFVNVARRRAAAEQGALFADQFESGANFRAHLATGAELWAQTHGRLDAFVAGAGTGGTLAGVSRYLKAQDPRVCAFLVDPPGSSLFNRVQRGVAYSPAEAEGRRLRHPDDTVVEGVGLNRLTANFLRAELDGAFRCSDCEAVEMAAYLLRNEGLFVGSSAAVNCVGAVRAARALGRPGAVIVTVLCDGGGRHLSRFHSAEYLAARGLAPAATGAGLEFIA